MDKVSYALGLSIAQNFKSSGINSLNTSDFVKAIDDVFSEKSPEITYEEAKSIINEYFEDLQQKRFKNNKEAGEEFLKINKHRSDVTELPSGVQYQILQQGEGSYPTLADKVKCHYHGTLINGVVFDSSVERGTPAVFPVSGVIPGWTEVLQIMPVGSKWRVVIPYDKAYGDRGAGQMIEPYSTLIFDIELLAIE